MELAPGVLRSECGENPSLNEKRGAVNIKRKYIQRLILLEKERAPTKEER